MSSWFLLQSFTADGNYGIHFIGRHAPNSRELTRALRQNLQLFTTTLKFTTDFKIILKTYQDSNICSYYRKKSNFVS